MNAVFADTVYWVATLRPDDPWRSAALQAYRRISPVRLVTTDEVLVEFLALVSGADPGVRKRAAMLVRALLSHPNVDVYAQSRESFLGGLSLYEARPDKGYSLTDYCHEHHARRRHHRSSHQRPPLRAGRLRRPDEALTYFPVQHGGRCCMLDSWPDSGAVEITEVEIA